MQFRNFLWKMLFQVLATSRALRILSVAFFALLQGLPSYNQICIIAFLLPNLMVLRSAQLNGNLLVLPVLKVRYGTG